MSFFVLNDVKSPRVLSVPNKQHIQYTCILITFYFIDTHFNTHQQQTAFENIVGKEEIARNEQFLLFPQCFLLNQKNVSPICRFV